MKKELSPILILDRKGIVGEFLAEKLCENRFVVFVTEKKEMLIDPSDEQLLLINNYHRVPEIPESIYSHIFVVHEEGKRVNEYLEQIIQKAQADGARCVFIANLHNISEKTIKNLEPLYRNLIIILSGDLFGKRVLPLTQSTIHRFQREAHESERLVVFGNGLISTYPVFIEDVIEKIIGIALDKDVLGSKVYFLFPKNPPTEFSLAYTIHKINPLIRIDFSSQKKSVDSQDKHIQIPSRGVFLLNEQYNLEKKIKDSQVFSEEELEKKEHKEKQRKGTKKKSSFAPAFVRATLLFALSLLFLPFASTVLFSFLGTALLSNARQVFEQGHFEKAYTSSQASVIFFDLAGRSFDLLSLELWFLNLQKNDSYPSFLSFGKEISTSLSLASSSFEAFQNILLQKSTKKEQDFLRAVSLAKTTIVSMQEIEIHAAELSAKNKGLLRPAELIVGEKTMARFFKTIKDMQSSIGYAGSILEASSYLFGIDGQRSYLVLFQNNMELRPTGGFIGSYGILDLKEGRVANFSIHDVYDADGQLKGHIEPPYPIRRYIPMVHWFLRDSNFNVDFPKSASSSAYFLREETGRIVDGVIAVDVSFIQEILKALGPIFIPEYKETVHADNVYMLIQKHTEKDFFPGSTQKKDFLRSLFKALTLRISNRRDIAYRKLLEALGRGISEKHVLFAFSNQSIQEVFSTQRLSSTLFEERERGSNFVDFLGVSEANLGANKANYFIRRKIDYTVSVDKEGSTASELSLLYKNTNVKNTWPGGNYKNYLRLIVSKGARIISITIDGTKQDIVDAITDPLKYEAKDFKPPKGLEVETYEQDDKTIFGFLVVVPAGSMKEIKVFYQPSDKIPVEKPISSYSLRFFKQPGVDEVPFSFVMKYPDSLNILSLDKDIRKENYHMRYSSVLRSDKDLAIQFFQKSIQ